MLWEEAIFKIQIILGITIIQEWMELSYRDRKKRVIKQGMLVDSGKKKNLISLDPEKDY